MDVINGPMIAIVLAYFVPSLIASIRGHHNEGAIFLLNLLLGWTGLGWVIALIWSATAVRREGYYARRGITAPRSFF